LQFSEQVLARNPKKKRGYDIFHALLDNNVTSTEGYYASALESIAAKDIPAAIGEALKRYSDRPELKDTLENKFKQTKSPASIAYKSK